MRFRDRSDAGRQLAARLLVLSLDDPVVLALPRGGVPVGYEVALALDAPLEVFVARKVGAPGHREFGIGAIAEDGVVAVDDATLRMLGIERSTFDRLASEERAELERRVAVYRQGRELPALNDREIVLVDDGLATGVTAEAGAVALARRHPRRLVLAVPTCATDSAARLATLVDDVVCVISADDFAAVGAWYSDFRQTTDADVDRLLRRAAERWTDGR